jgi:hypothetical protein
MTDSLTISSSRAPRPQPEGPTPERRRIPTRLTGLVAALALAASVAGLFLDGIYPGAAATAEMLRGFDLVTAVLVIPSLVVASHFAHRGSVMPQLISVSLVAELVYTYGYHLFGTGFNDLFLLHAAIFAGGVCTLVLSVAAVDLGAVTDRFEGRTPVRAVAGILGALAVALGGMWVYVAVDNAITGDVPTGSRLVETDTVVRLGMALDLTLLVPLYAVAAVLLWRRAPWGYVLAAVALFAGILHQISYMVALPFQTAAEIPGAVSFDAGEPVIVLVYLLATTLLIFGRPRRGSWRRRGHLLVAAVAIVNTVGAGLGAVGLVTGWLPLDPTAIARLPWDSVVLGGVALGLVVMLPNALLSILALRRDGRCGAASVAAGTLLVGWILVQLAFVREVSLLHPLYLAIGALQMWLGARFSRSHMHPGPFARRGRV